MQMNVDIIRVENGKLAQIRIGDTLYDVSEHQSDLTIVKVQKEVEKQPRQRIPRRSGKYNVKPVGALWKDKTYNIWVTKDAVNKVKQAIVHVGFGYQATTDEICKQTGFSISKTRAVLRQMRLKGLAKIVWKDKQKVYQLIEEGQK